MKENATPFGPVRASLVGLAAGAVVGILCIFIALLRDWILLPDVVSLLGRMLEIYSVPFGLVAGSVFAKHALKGPLVSGPGIMLASGAIVAWSLLVTAPLLLLAASVLGEPAVMSITLVIHTKGAFLIVAALGYIFGQQVRESND